MYGIFIHFIVHYYKYFFLVYKTTNEVTLFLLFRKYNFKSDNIVFLPLGTKLY